MKPYMDDYIKHIQMWTYSSQTGILIQFCMIYIGSRPSVDFLHWENIIFSFFHFENFILYIKNQNLGKKTKKLHIKLIALHPLKQGANVCAPFSDFYNSTPIFELFIGRCGSKDKHTNTHVEKG